MFLGFGVSLGSLSNVVGLGFCVTQKSQKKDYFDPTNNLGRTKVLYKEALRVKYKSTFHLFICRTWN